MVRRRNLLTQKILKRAFLDPEKIEFKVGENVKITPLAASKLVTLDDMLELARQEGYSEEKIQELREKYGGDDEAQGS